MPVVSINYRVNPDLLSAETTHAWWISGGTDAEEEYTSTLGIHLTFNNGQQAVLVTKGLFEMHRPSAMIVDRHYYGTPTVVWTDPWGTPWLDAGEISVGDVTVNNAMEFKAAVESRFDGKAKWIQMIDFLDMTGTGFLDCVPVINPTVSNVLDNQDPYMGIWDVDAGAVWGEQNIPLLDQPSATSSGVYPYQNPVVVLNGEFRDYLMFRPDGGGNIWVTLAETTWSAMAGAEWPSNDIVPNEVSGPTDLVDSMSFPEWISVFSNP